MLKILGAVDLSGLNFVRDKSVLVAASSLVILSKYYSTKHKTLLAESFGQRF
jgi:hypothetical protein